MLVSLFTVTAMAADQQRDRDQDCTGVPDDALRTQTRAGINAGGMVTGVCDGSNCDEDGVCDNFVDEDGDGICDNCQGDGVCDGDGPYGNGRGYGNGDGDGVCDGPCATD